jgi:GntR family transcriptional regulator
MELVREPIYQQLCSRLRELAGKSPEGTRFAPERELALRFGVSRATTNKAVATLVGEGVLEFRKGVGTFVAKPKPGGLRYDLRSLVSFTAHARAVGRVPSTRVLVFDRPADAPAQVRAALAEDGGWVHLVRLRLADGEPVILEDRWLAGSAVPGLTQERCEGSLYSLLVDGYGLRLAGAEQSISAVGVTDAEASALGVSPGSACLCVTAVGLSEGDRPIWWERTLYRSEVYAFSARLTGLSGSGAVGRFVEAGT